MTRHIGRQNHSDHSLSKRLELVLREFLKKVESFRVDNCKGLGNMEVLLNTLVIVTNCPLTNCIYMVRIIKTIMCKIMTNRGNNNAKSVQFVELSKLQEIALL